MDKSAQSSLFYNSLKLEKIQMPINKKLEKYILAYLENKILHTNFFKYSYIQDYA